MSVNSDAQRILSGWFMRGFINTAINAVIGVNLFVAVWGGATTPLQRALYLIIADGMAMFWSSFQERQHIRAFVMQNYLKILWFMILSDMLLLPIYLINPYIYLIIFMIIFDGAYFFIFVTMLNETREVLLPSPNDRNNYAPKFDKIRSAGSIVGGVVSIFLPLAEYGPMWMILAMIIGSLVCGTMTTFAFKSTLQYMKQRNIQFFCCTKLQECPEDHLATKIRQIFDKLGSLHR